MLQKLVDPLVPLLVIFSLIPWLNTGIGVGLSVDEGSTRIAFGFLNVYNTKLFICEHFK